MKNTPDNIQNLHQRDGRLICPSCGEFLCRQDIEFFFRCPYCNHRFLLDGEMEDFLLKQVVEHWCQMNLEGMAPPPPMSAGPVRSNWI